MKEQKRVNTWLFASSSYGFVEKEAKKQYVHWLIEFMNKEKSTTK